MALVAKTGATTATAGAVAARYAGSSPTVASISQPAIESPNGGAGLAFDTTTFAFREDPRGFAHNDNERRQAPWTGSTLLASSQTFAAIMESGDGAAGDGARSNATRHFEGFLSKAIATYETNAKIIHGQMEQRGSMVSMRL